MLRIQFLTYSVVNFTSGCEMQYLQNLFHVLFNENSLYFKGFKVSILVGQINPLCVLFLKIVLKSRSKVVETWLDKVLLSHMLQRRLVNFQTIPYGRPLISYWLIHFELKYGLVFSDSITSCCPWNFGTRREPHSKSVNSIQRFFYGSFARD
jgi:hypothetical protein